MSMVSRGITRLYEWYGKRTVRIIGLIVIVLLVVGLIISSRGSTVAEEVAEQLPTVNVAPAASQTTAASVELIGTVKAVSQAQIETEVGGRIVSVNVDLGDTVAAGQILAQQENASERASVLQAEGAYEAALAAAASSDVGLDEASNNVAAANNSALATYRSSYTTANSVVRNVMDQFFTNPEDGAIPGIRLEGPNTLFLNEERIAFRSILSDWQQRAESITSGADLVAELREAQQLLNRLNAMVDAFTITVADNKNEERYTAAELGAFREQLNTARVSVNSSINEIDTTITAINNAEEALERAQISGTGSAVSSADAQVKQALGSLRSAQANLEKTILRTPIAGTVNSLSVDAGDFVGSFARIAEVANNNALEITTFVGERDRESITVGQIVSIEGGVEGTVTSIAPAVDSETRKIEVKIATEAELFSGDTVTITLDQENVPETVEQRLFVPITAVKFTAESGSIFTVEDGLLTANPVEIGEIRGTFVEVLNGIEATTIIVLDARGLTAGESVEAIQQN
ncbi:MAG: HlyD family efflux transporter periplasmic adaptor subunit [Patescibacteria group bacterium]